MCICAVDQVDWVTDSTQLNFLTLALTNPLTLKKLNASEGGGFSRNMALLQFVGENDQGFRIASMVFISHVMSRSISMISLI